MRMDVSVVGELNLDLILYGVPLDLEPEREHLARNLALVDALKGIADRHSVTVAQLAIAWVLARGDDIVPLIGARTVDRLHEALGAVRVALTPETLAEIEAAVPAGAAAGDRYPTPLMAHLDSERVQPSA